MPPQSFRVRRSAELLIERHGAASAADVAANMAKDRERDVDPDSAAYWRQVEGKIRRHLAHGQPVAATSRVSNQPDLPMPNPHTASTGPWVKRAGAVAWGLAFGLIAGPLLSNAIGWQMLSSTARTRISESLVQQQAMFCDVQARLEVPEPGKLEWITRLQLAERFALMPGATRPDYDVVSACARKLGNGSPARG